MSTSRFSPIKLKRGVGQIKLDKKLGKTILIEAAACDEHGGLYTRASYKILGHWRKGELPDSTCWAS
jgi:hypothetical protein